MAWAGKSSVSSIIGVRRGMSLREATGVGGARWYLSVGVVSMLRLSDEEPGTRDEAD